MGKSDVRRAEKARAAAQADERKRVVLRVLQACSDAGTEELARLAARGVTASCAPGCVHCCHLEVPLTRAEAEVIAGWLREHKTEAELDAIRDRLRGWLAWYRDAYVREVAAGRSRDDVFFRDGPACALLDGGYCGAYDVRPVTCRNHYVSSPVRECDPAVGGGDVDVLVSIAVATQPHTAEIRGVVERQGGNWAATVHLLPEWLAHLLDVEREPWIGAPPLRIG